ncbi:hypothetical protein ABZ341_13680 [Streptomyces sp. NPDC006173]|uniref:hypothetical protein n=1 Tax=Streptomyces sp. NPDC006173 TaxID=3155349 RepID=UPI0033EF98A8
MTSILHRARAVRCRDGLHERRSGHGRVLDGSPSRRHQSVPVRLGRAAQIRVPQINLPLTLAALVLVGSGSITFNASAKTLLQVKAAPQMRGRVVSIWSIGWMGGTVIGAPTVGAVGAVGGPRSALLVGGLAAVAVGLAMLVLPLSDERRIAGAGRR